MDEDEQEFFDVLDHEETLVEEIIALLAEGGK